MYQKEELEAEMYYSIRNSDQSVTSDKFEITLNNFTAFLGKDVIVESSEEEDEESDSENEDTKEQRTNENSKTQDEEDDYQGVITELQFEIRELRKKLIEYEKSNQNLQEQIVNINDERATEIAELLLERDFYKEAADNGKSTSSDGMKIQELLIENEKLKAEALRYVSTIKKSRSQEQDNKVSLPSERVILNLQLILAHFYTLGDSAANLTTVFSSKNRKDLKGWIGVKHLSIPRIQAMLKTNQYLEILIALHPEGEQREIIDGNQHECTILNDCPINIANGTASHQIKGNGNFKTLGLSILNHLIERNFPNSKELTQLIGLILQTLCIMDKNLTIPVPLAQLTIARGHRWIAASSALTKIDNFSSSPREDKEISQSIISNLRKRSYGFPLV